MVFRPWVYGAACLACFTVAQAKPAYWSRDIAAFTAADAKQMPLPDGVVFVGSSSIRLWTTLDRDFPGVHPINRGFGGSELADSVFYEDRIVLPYHPRAVVLYAGDNDIAAGKSPETVAADFTTFRSRLHTALPRTRLYFLSIKVSGSRLRFRPQIEKANQLIAAECAAHPGCVFVDLATPLLDAKGNPRPELFRADQLHLNPAGYAVWTRILSPLLQP